MLLTDEWLKKIYEQTTRRGFPPDGMPLLKAFVTKLLDHLPVAGYIDEDNNMNFDEFMLPGTKTRKLYDLPELEKDDESFPPF